MKARGRAIRSLIAVLAVAAVGAAPASAQSGDESGSAGDSVAAPAGVFVHDLLEAVPPAGTQIDRLDIDNRLGDVRVVGHDGRGLSIFAVKHAPDEATLERLEVKLIQDPSGPVSIRTQLAQSREGRAIPAGSARIDLVVRVPRGARVGAKVWNGHVKVRGLDNGAEVSANEGDIHLAQVSGSIVADSAVGTQRFEEIFGELETTALLGDVDLSLIRGKRLSASVKTGNVTADQVRVHDLVIRVIKGDIRLSTEVVAGGRYVIASYAGDVEARIVRKDRRRIEILARSDRGTLRLPERLRPRATSTHEVVGYLGAGRSPAHVEVRSVTGNVVVAEF